jgi:hypothetical protein
MASKAHHNALAAWCVTTAKMMLMTMQINATIFPMPMTMPKNAFLKVEINAALLLQSGGTPCPRRPSLLTRRPSLRATPSPLKPSLDVGQIFYCETFGLPLLSSPGVVAVADALPSSTLVPLVVSGVGIGLPLLSAPGVPMVAPGSDWALGAVVSAAYATPIVKAR